jgi:diaminopimelate epimerase
MTMTRRRFWKMSGSGNDFVFFDAMHDPAGALASPEVIGRLCERRTGIGADGVVFLEPHPERAFFMRYFNRDGSLAEMCGNAALCSTRLARELGIVEAGDFAFETVSGPVTGRFTSGGPEIDMVPVTELQAAYPSMHEPAERRMGFARVGVPHLVLLVDDVSSIDVSGRGRSLRHLATLRDGANVNFVSQDQSGAWTMRTYERGVEEETLACGTGAVATAALLTTWGMADHGASLRTRSGRSLEVRIPAVGSAQAPVLRGEGRIVFEGTLAEL